MAKELMEIGGFITEGAEIVNHDSSLSGNGTVDSPLGVVPGYNETVLWEGDWKFTASGQNNAKIMNDSITNYEYLFIDLYGYAGGQPSTNIIRTGNGGGVIEVKNWGGSNDTVRFNFATFGFSANSAWIGNTKQVSLNFNNTLTTGNPNNAGIIRVVGVNRKA